MKNKNTISSNNIDSEIGSTIEPNSNQSKINISIRTYSLNIFQF